MGEEEFKIQEFKIQEFKIQEFKIQEFKIQEFKIQEFQASAELGTDCENPDSCILHFPASCILNS